MALVGRPFTNFPLITSADPTDIMLVYHGTYMAQITTQNFLAPAAAKQVKFYTSPDLDTTSEVEAMVGKMKNLTAVAFNVSEEPGVVAAGHFYFQVRLDKSDGSAVNPWVTHTSLAALETALASHTADTAFHLRVLNNTSTVDAALIIKYVS